MGVKVIERKYKNQFYPSTQSTDWLLGNVGDWQRLELTFEVTIEFNGTQSETISIDSTNNTLKLNNGKSWQSYGFDIGDACIMSWVVMLDPGNTGSFTETPFVLNFNIQNLYGDTLETDVDFDFGQWTLIPTDRGNVKVVDVKVETLKEPQGMKFRYSHIANENYQTSNLTSFIDGTVTEFSYAGLNNLPTGVTALMNPDGLQSGMAIDNCRIQKLGNGGNVFDATFGLASSGSQRLQTYKWVSAFNSSNILSISDIDAVVVPMNKLTGAAPYQSVPVSHVPISTSSLSGGNYLGAPAGSKFLNNSNTAGVRVFDIDFKFKITATNENSTSDRVSLVLLKYNSSGNFSQRLELKSWNNASSLVNQTLSHNDLATINLGAGEGLILALEYFHTAQTTHRYIDVTFLEANVKAIQNGQSGQASAYTYKLTCDFMLASIFEEVSNLENNVAPSILFNAGSLTDNFELIVYPEWNNPNTVIKNNLKHTERLGNTGWFNENFNGLDNNFIVESLKYTDTSGNVVDQLDYANTVIVEAEVSGIGNLSANSEFGLGFAWIPRNEADYKNKYTPYHENLLINTARKYVDGSFNLNENNGSTVYQGNSFGNPRIDIVAEGGVMFIPVTGDKAKMKVRFTPNADFTNFFNSKADNDRKYILWISVADHTSQINFSDRVSLLLDYNDMVKVIPPAGPLPGMTNRFIEHPRHEEVSGEAVYYGHIEDDILSRVTFKIPKTKQMQQISFGYEVLNTLTGADYTLENISKNAYLFPADANGIQQINIDDTRGFKLVSGNNKNWVKIKRESSLDAGNDVGYKCFFATKIRWEDWIVRSGVPVEFFNGSLPNNGYHNNWLDYLRNSPNHKINFFVEITVIENGELKRHKNTFELSFNGYDENLNIQTEHRYLRHSDNTLLNIGTDPSTGKPLGVILNNEPTRIEIIYTNLAGDFDFVKTYAVTSLEVDKGAGEMEYRQLSSVWLSEGDNPLIPLSGETKLKLELLAPNVIKTSCLVDPTLLEQVERYKITGRIGCFKEGENQEPPFGLYEERYEEVYQ